MKNLFRQIKKKKQIKSQSIEILVGRQKFKYVSLLFCILYMNVLIDSVAARLLCADTYARIRYETECASIHDLKIKL